MKFPVPFVVQNPPEAFNTVAANVTSELEQMVWSSPASAIGPCINEIVTSSVTEGQTPLA